MRLLPAGQDAVLVEVDSTEEAIALHAAAVRARVEATEIVPGARTVLFDGLGESARVWLGGLDGLDRRGGLDGVDGVDRREVVTLDVDYDGPDLASTAALLGMTPDALVAAHTDATFTVAFCGFAPGFAYCTGWGHEVPRLESPRARVEPGSVGLAGPFTGVYPSASPGGWRLIGRTDVPLWDADRQPPALLAPGTRVRFVAR